MAILTDFQFYMNFAKPLILNLPDLNERIKASAWVKRLSEGQGDSEESKIDCLKLLLFVLQKGKLGGPFIDTPDKFATLADIPNLTDFIAIAKSVIENEYRQRNKKMKSPYISDFSGDMKQFAAAQEIPKFGVHAYYAFSQDPIPIWDRASKVKLPKVLKDDELTPPLPPSPDGEAGEAPPAEPVPECLRKFRKPDCPPVLPIGAVIVLDDDNDMPTWGSNLLEVNDEVPHRDLRVPDLPDLDLEEASDDTSQSSARFSETPIQSTPLIPKKHHKKKVIKTKKKEYDPKTGKTTETEQIEEVMSVSSIDEKKEEEQLQQSREVISTSPHPSKDPQVQKSFDQAAASIAPLMVHDPTDDLLNPQDQEVLEISSESDLDPNETDNLADKCLKEMQKQLSQSIGVNESNVSRTPTPRRGKSPVLPDIQDLPALPSQPSREQSPQPSTSTAASPGMRPQPQGSPQTTRESRRGDTPSRSPPKQQSPREKPVRQQSDMSKDAEKITRNARSELQRMAALKELMSQLPEEERCIPPLFSKDPRLREAAEGMVYYPEDFGLGQDEQFEDAPKHFEKQKDFSPYEDTRTTAREKKFRQQQQEQEDKLLEDEDLFDPSAYLEEPQESQPVDRMKHFQELERAKRRDHLDNPALASDAPITSPRGVPKPKRPMIPTTHEILSEEIIALPGGRFKKRIKVKLKKKSKRDTSGGRRKTSEQSPAIFQATPEYAQQPRQSDSFSLWSESPPKSMKKRRGKKTPRSKEQTPKEPSVIPPTPARTEPEDPLIEELRAHQYIKPVGMERRSRHPTRPEFDEKIDEAIEELPPLIAPTYQRSVHVDDYRSPTRKRLPEPIRPVSKAIAQQRPRLEEEKTQQLTPESTNFRDEVAQQPGQSKIVRRTMRTATTRIPNKPAKKSDLPPVDEPLDYGVSPRSRLPQDEHPVPYLRPPSAKQLNRRVRPRKLNMDKELEDAQIQLIDIGDIADIAEDYERYTGQLLPRTKQGKSILDEPVPRSPLDKQPALKPKILHSGLPKTPERPQYSPPPPTPRPPISPKQLSRDVGRIPVSLSDVEEPEYIDDSDDEAPAEPPVKSAPHPRESEPESDDNECVEVPTAPPAKSPTQPSSKTPSKSPVKTPRRMVEATGDEMIFEELPPEYQSPGDISPASRPSPTQRMQQPTERRQPSPSQALAASSTQQVPAKPTTPLQRLSPRPFLAPSPTRKPASRSPHLEATPKSPRRTDAAEPPSPASLRKQFEMLDKSPLSKTIKSKKTIKSLSKTGRPRMTTVLETSREYNVPKSPSGVAEGELVALPPQYEAEKAAQKQLAALYDDDVENDIFERPGDRRNIMDAMVRQSDNLPSGLLDPGLDRFTPPRSSAQPPPPEEMFDDTVYIIEEEDEEEEDSLDMESSYELDDTTDNDDDLVLEEVEEIEEELTYDEGDDARIRGGEDVITEYEDDDESGYEETEFDIEYQENEDLFQEIYENDNLIQYYKAPRGKWHAEELM